MRQFKDNAGKSWTVDVNVAALKRVRGLTGVDLMRVIDGTGGLIERLIRDPVLLCDVVYAVCKPETDARGVSDEEFGRAMAGDAIEAATTAVLEELVSFCPSSRDRANLGRVLQATRRVMDKARDLTEKRIETLTSESALDTLLNQSLTPGATPGGSSTAAPGSSASTPVQ